MAGVTKVGPDQIRQALECWRGNVAATAASLGIAENSLRKRMKNMGIGAKALALLRSVRISATHTHPHLSSMPTPQGDDRQPKDTQQQNAAHIYPAPTPLRRFGSVQDGLPAAARLPKARLRPDQIDRLRDAKYDFQAKHRTDLREEDLLQQFFDEEFAAWIKRGLSDAAGKRKRAESQQQV